MQSISKFSQTDKPLAIEQIKLLNTHVDKLPPEHRRLLEAASSILNWLVHINYLSCPEDIESLRTELIAEVKAFEQRAKFTGVPAMQVLAARYLLCSFIDEMILNSHWEKGFFWSRQSMLSHFHQETWGGERFFELLQRFKQNPAENLDLLLFIYAMLAMGFEGKYRLSSGLAELKVKKQELYQLLKQHHCIEERPSPKLHFEQKKSSSFWGLAGIDYLLITLIVLIFIFSSYKISLYYQSKPIVNTIQAINTKFTLVRGDL